jgi:hypothetical protein
MSSTDHLCALRDALQRIGDAVIAEPADAIRPVIASLLQVRRLVDGLLIAALAHFETLGAFRAEGAFDAAGYLRSLGVSGRDAKELGRAMDAAAAFRCVAASLTNGVISATHAALLHPMIDHVTAGHATVESIDELVRTAASESSDAFRHRVAQAELVAQSKSGKDRRSRQRENSRLHTSDRDDGMKGINVALDPDRNAIVLHALDALVDEHWRSGTQSTERPATRELPKLRADALVEMARRSLTGTVHDASSSAQPSSSRRGEAQVVVLIDLETLLSGIDRVGGVCMLDDGTPIAGETARRIACEANVIPVVLGSKSEVLDVGRGARLATAAQRTALRLRSATCEFPGCTVPARHSRAHHIDPWDHDGRTDLDNLVWLCSHHHHAVHEGRWTLQRHEAQILVRRPDGTIFCHAPPGREAAA